MVAIFLAMQGVALYYLISYARVSPVSFDGAMNLNVARSWLKGDGYGFFYDQFFPFPAQTDAPYIFPAALIFRIFGISILTSQLPNLLYLALLLLSVGWLMRSYGANWTWVLCGCTLVLFTPGIVEYGLNGYGEIPSLAWYTLGLATLVSESSQTAGNMSKRALCAGIFFAMACLTKVVALMLVAPIYAVLILIFLLRKSERKWAASAVLAFIGPVLVWEIFRWHEVGSFNDYIQWWSLQIGQVMHQSGASSSPSISLQKAGVHSGILADYLGMPAIAMLLVLFAFLVTVFGFASGRPRLNYVLIGLLMSAVSYFLWWIFVTPTRMAWPRRILDGVLVLEIFLICFVAQFKKKEKISIQILIYLFVGAVLSDFAVNKNGIFFASKNSFEANVRSDFWKEVEKLPATSKFFGYKWWQNPDVALYTGKRFNNLALWLPSAVNDLNEKKYLIFDYFVIKMAPSVKAEALRNLEVERIYEGEGGEIYEIKHAYPFPPLTIEGDQIGLLSSSINFAKDPEYIFHRGFYPPEGGKMVWMGPSSRVVLLRRDQSQLRIKLFVPTQLMTGGPVMLRLNAAGCSVHQIPLEAAGLIDVSITLNCDAGPQATPLIVDIDVDRHIPPVRQIDADNRLLAVLVESIELGGD